MKIRIGNIGDLTQIKHLAQHSWQVFEKDLTPENWQKLADSLSRDTLYRELLTGSTPFVCETQVAK